MLTHHFLEDTLVSNTQESHDAGESKASLQRERIECPLNSRILAYLIRKQYNNTAESLKLEARITEDRSPSSPSPLSDILDLVFDGGLASSVQDCINAVKGLVNKYETGKEIASEAESGKKDIGNIDIQDLLGTNFCIPAPNNLLDNTANMIPNFTFNLPTQLPINPVLHTMSPILRARMQEDIIKKAIQSAGFGTREIHDLSHQERLLVVNLIKREQAQDPTYSSLKPPLPVHDKQSRTTTPQPFLEYLISDSPSSEAIVCSSSLNSSISRTPTSLATSPTPSSPVFTMQQIINIKQLAIAKNIDVSTMDQAGLLELFHEMNAQEQDNLLLDSIPFEVQQHILLGICPTGMSNETSAKCRELLIKRLNSLPTQPLVTPIQPNFQLPSQHNLPLHPQLNLPMTINNPTNFINPLLQPLSPRLAKKRKTDDESNSLIYLASLTGCDKKLHSCCFNQSGIMIVAVGDKRILRWNLYGLYMGYKERPTDKQPRTIKESIQPEENCFHGAHISSIKFIKESIFATASSDTTVKVWELNHTLSLLKTYIGHTVAVTGVDFFVIDRDIICVSIDTKGDLHYWNISNLLILKKIALRIEGEIYGTNPVRTRPQGARKDLSLVTAFSNRLYYITSTYPIIQNEKVQLIKCPHRKPITNLNWTPNGNWLLTSSEDVVCLWDATSADSAHNMKLHCEIGSQHCKITCSAFLKEVRQTKENARPRIIFGGYETIHLWSQPEEEEQSRIVALRSCQSGAIYCLDSCVRDGKLLIASSSAGGKTGNMKLYELVQT